MMSGAPLKPNSIATHETRTDAVLEFAWVGSEMAKGILQVQHAELYLGFLKGLRPFQYGPSVWTARVLLLEALVLGHA